MRTSSSISLAMPFLLLPFSISADILVLDLNFSTEEVRTIREEAARRIPPEKVVVLPAVPDNVREKMGKLRLHEHEPAALKELTATGKAYRFTVDQLDRAISENEFTSIHISGHSDGPTFSGYTTNNFDVKQLDQIIRLKDGSANSKWEAAKQHIEVSKKELREAFEKRAEILDELSDAKRLLAQSDKELDRIQKELARLKSKLIPNKKAISELERILQSTLKTRAADQQDVDTLSSGLSSLNAEITQLSRTFKEDSEALKSAEAKKSLADSSPTKRSKISSVYLWGCYSNTAQQTLWWNDHFPDLNFLAGFDGTAPLGTTKVAKDMLRDLLRVEDQLSAACTPEDLKKILSSPELTEINSTNSSIAILNDDYCGISSRNSGTHSLSEIKSACSRLESSVEKGLETFQSYWIPTSTDHIDPPNSTGAGTPLREFYNLIQRNQHCIPFYTSFDTSEIPSPATIRTLLFFNTFKVNFTKYHRELIDDVNQALLQVGIKKSDLFPTTSEIKTLSRLELLDRLGRFSDHLNKITNKVDLDRFHELVSHASSGLILLDCYTDISWIEPSDENGSGLPEPSC